MMELLIQLEEKGMGSPGASRQLHWAQSPSLTTLKVSSDVRK